MSGQAGVLLRHGSVGTTPFILGQSSPRPLANMAVSQRKVNADYAGPVLNIRRSSDNTTMDIGLSGSDFDSATALTFVGAGDGFVTTRYDQSQLADGTLNHHDIIFIDPANQPRIIHAGVMETKNGLPLMRAPDQNRGGVTNPFTAYTGTAVTAFAVGSLSPTASDGPQRILSLLPTTTTQMDAVTAGAALISRQDSVAIGKAEQLVDNFATADSSKWTGYGLGVSIVSGQLNIIPTSTYNGLISVSKYDLTGSHFVAQLVQRANRGNNTIENQMVVQTDASNQMMFIVSGTSLTMRERAAGSNSDTLVAYSAATHKWLRLRESAGTLYWDASPDGSTWTNLRTKTRAMTNPTSTSLKLVTGYYGTETTLGTTIWDTANTVGQATPTANWAIQRNNAVQDSVLGIPGTLQQVTAQISGALATLTVDGTAQTATVTSSAFNFSRYGNGHDGITPQSAPDAYDAEILVFHSAVSTTDISYISLDQANYWGTAGQTPDPSGGYSLVAEDTFDDNVFRTSNFAVYNFGTMTNNAGAWMSDCVSVSNQRMRLLAQRVSTPIVIGGTSYGRKGGACYWQGPSSSAFAHGGMWQTRVRMDACAGFGWAILLWPKEGSTDPTKSNYFAGQASWPINGEIDVLELYSSNTSKHGGESNWHLDTVPGSGRHLKCPTTAAHGLTANVTAGNYQIDWTVFHDLKCVWIPGQRIEVYVDNVLVGYTTDPTYVPSGTHNSTFVPFRFTFQIECYGTADSVADFNPYYAEMDMLRYYALP